MFFLSIHPKGMINVVEVILTQEGVKNGKARDGEKLFFVVKLSQVILKF